MEHLGDHVSVVREKALLRACASRCLCLRTLPGRPTRGPGFDVVVPRGWPRRAPPPQARPAAPAPRSATPAPPPAPRRKHRPPTPPPPPSTATPATQARPRRRTPPNTTTQPH